MRDPRSLIACALIALDSFSASAQQPVPPPPASDFAPCVTQLRADALKRGIDGAAFDGWFAGVEADPSVLELLDRQPEFTMQPWDYLAALVDEKRIADGRRKMAAHSELLQRIEETYGVERQVLV